jgi:tRNA U34 5-carboxymethylaminomethyl modifying GTPase MnmE/TrmE
VIEFLGEYKNNCKNIEEEIISLIYHMKGSISWEEAWETTTENRKAIHKTVSKIMKEQNKK